MIEENTPCQPLASFSMFTYMLRHIEISIPCIPTQNVREYRCMHTDRMKFPYYTGIHYFIEGIRLGGLLFLGIHASLVGSFCVTKLQF